MYINLIAAIFLIVACLLSNISIACTDKGSYIHATPSQNAFLAPDDCLYSPNRQFVAVMQTDGNLVVYPTNNFTPAGHRWQNGRAGNPGSWLAMQQDGNLVEYRNPRNPNTHIWDSQTSMTFLDYILLMQDDGNLVIYRGTSPDHRGGPVWSWMTGDVRPRAASCPSCDDKCRIVFPGGNVVDPICRTGCCLGIPFPPAPKLILDGVCGDPFEKYASHVVQYCQSGFGVDQGLITNAMNRLIDAHIVSNEDFSNVSVRW